MTDSKTLSIIIVNYNGAKFLVDCLESIQEKCFGVNHEVIIVDNDSQDNSVDLIKSNFSWVSLIESPDNLGFSKGNNLGVQKSSGEYILLLNNDTILLDHLSKILSHLVDEKVGLLGAKMLGAKNEYRRSAGLFPSPIRLLKLSQMYCSKNGFSDGDFKSTPELLNVDWVEGSFMLLTRKVWNDVGGMDGDYFMYAEDIDLCKKISQTGRKVLYFQNCRYVHYGGYSAARESLLMKGLNRYNRKFHHGVYFILCQLCIKINSYIKSVKNNFRKITS